MLLGSAERGVRSNLRCKTAYSRARLSKCFRGMTVREWLRSHYLAPLDHFEEPAPSA